MEDGMKLNIILFALTGFGNPVLHALLRDNRVNLQAVFTVKYDQPFPYYEERQLLDECSEKGINCHYDVKVSSDIGLKLLEKYSPDLIIVATFKQILKEEVIKLPKLGVVNFHPSLLPKYRGPSPTNAVLLNNERMTGVTVHYMTKDIDEGDILLQRSANIVDVENDGFLRKKLANIYGELVPDLVDLFIGSEAPKGTPQDHHLATPAPRPDATRGYLELACDVDKIRNMMRAYNPLPGTSILVGDKRYVVDRFEEIRDERVDGLYENTDYIDVIVNSRAIRLFKK
jgi:methionyl-tRNA formyltransferase